MMDIVVPEVLVRAIMTIFNVDRNHVSIYEIMFIHLM